MKRKGVFPRFVGMLLLSTIARSQQPASITLEELVQSSLAKNRDLLALRQRVGQAKGLARQAGVRPAPTVEAEGVSGRPLGSPGETQFSAAFIQPVETFGKRRDRVRVADLGVALAEAEVDERSTKLAYEMETAYLSVVYERERIAVLERVLANFRESQRLTDARVREGDAAQLEAQLLSVELSRTDAQRADATGRLAAAAMEIRRLAGLAPTDPLPAIGPPSGGKAPLSPEQLISRALEKRADVRTARLLEQQGEAETTLAKSQARPDVTLSARYVYNNSRLEDQYGYTASGVPTPLREQYNTLSVGVSIPLTRQRRLAAKAFREEQSARALSRSDVQHRTLSRSLQLWMRA